MSEEEEDPFIKAARKRLQEKCGDEVADKVEAHSKEMLEKYRPREDGLPTRVELGLMLKIFLFMLPVFLISISGLVYERKGFTSLTQLFDWVIACFRTGCT